MSLQLQISGVRAIPLTASMEAGTITSQGAWGAVSIVLVEVTTVDGITGYGECLAKQMVEASGNVCGNFHMLLLIPSNRNYIRLVEQDGGTRLRKGQFRGLVGFLGQHAIDHRQHGLVMSLEDRLRRCDTLSASGLKQIDREAGRPLSLTSGIRRPPRVAVDSPCSPEQRCGRRIICQWLAAGQPANRRLCGLSSDR